MTKSDQAKLRRLELENAQLRARVAKDLEVFRDQALELIELRARLQVLREVLSESAT